MSRSVSWNMLEYINKATPLSVIIFHRWQKEQNPNRWRIRGLLFFYRPLVYFYSFFYFEIGRKSIEGMIDIGQMVAQTRSHLFRYFALEERKKNRIRVASRMQDERSSPVNFYIKRFDIPRNVKRKITKKKQFWFHNDKNSPNLLTKYNTTIEVVVINEIKLRSK